MRGTLVFVFITMLLLALLSACTTPGIKQASTDPLAGDRLYADVVKYVDFGEHRTAYPGDIKTSEWIAESLRQSGLNVELKTWTLKQFLLADCKLIVGGEKFDCFPGWYPNTTPVTGKLVPYDYEDTSNLKGNIAYAGSAYGILPYNRLDELVDAVSDAGAIGLVSVSRNHNDSGLLAAANAKRKGQGLDYYQAPLPITTVFVADDDDAKLAAAALAGATTSISINGEHRAEAKAHNVMATLKRGDRWIVVTTPSSGWFTCGGERGPGIALFLGLARWAAHQNTNHSYIFIANSGHELDNMGAHFTLDAYLPSYNITKENVTAWIHLGAGIACRSWQKAGKEFIPLDQPNERAFLRGTEELLPVFEPAFQHIPGLKIGAGGYAGELKEIANAGYNAFGFFGSNYFFHTLQDTEKETGPELLEPVARALTKALAELDSK
ncbi:MAG: hypothetical protein FJZ83_03185 [Chloroflexi bacterium]|nr:hypothetical protein [Chloroflexota bacterium]MBM3183019.1 hypothetical protein [Chloroflexota bacterium]MBM4451966.1 hypothetical protein [Chloroflexota bacterium]MBM4454696.1 hypothetical protein [Chloroflexota bacterium]